MRTEDTKAKNKKRNKRILSLCLVLCLVVGSVAGTLAWLTATGQLVNVFTVGSFLKPIDPTDPDHGRLDNYLIEPTWDESNSYLEAGKKIPKDPHVGIGAPNGKDGEEKSAYIFVKVEPTKKLGNHVAFQLGTGWEPVDGCTILSPLNAKSFEGIASEESLYSAGIFAYNAGIREMDEVKIESNMTNILNDYGYTVYKKFAGGDANDQRYITAHARNDETNTGSIDAWTAPVFSHVFVEKNADSYDFGGDGKDQMIVTAFIHETLPNYNDEMDGKDQAQFFTDVVTPAAIEKLGKPQNIVDDVSTPGDAAPAP